MIEYDDLIKHIKKEIRLNGYCRKKFSKLLWDWFEKSQKNREVLKRFDQTLFENSILVYTKSRNVR